MTDLEKHIKEQRLLLDSDAPREGHEERFLQKLGRDADQAPVRRFNFRHALQIAASIAIILTSAIVLMKQNKSGEKMAKQEVPAAMMEADMYYTSQVNARYDVIREFDFESSEEKAVLLDELKDLESYHQQLMDDLESNPDNDRVINALIRHYQIKLEVMDQIIIQLNQVKTETSEKNENESV
ncbi:MAG: hypothetical protein ABFS28_06850 [Bacteroidota bacterium]